MSTLNKFSLSCVFEKIKESKILKYLIIAVLCIVLVLVIFPKNLKENESISNDDYVGTLEEKLQNAISKIDGVGEVNVVITIESGMQTVLAMEKVTKQTEDGVEIIETPILVNGKTVVLTEKYPPISGVLIVVEDAKISTISKIQQATVSLLNIKLSQIEILTMK